MLPEGAPDWFIPDECVAAKSLLSLLCGKRLPFFWKDRFLDATYVTRTYLGKAQIRDNAQAPIGVEPVPLRSVEYGRHVVSELPFLFTSYLKLRNWFELDWIVGPLWYANEAHLDDRLGLATVSLERFATAHDDYIDNNPDLKRSKVKFLTPALSKSLRLELTEAVEEVANEWCIDLGTNQWPAVRRIIDCAVTSIARLDDSIFPADAVDSLRAKMTDAVRCVEEAGRLKLDLTKRRIIAQRINSFAEKTNSDKLVEALEFDGISVSDAESDAVMKRNDCLHGRRTLKIGANLGSIGDEVDRFDTLRMLVFKSVLARLGYRGLYVDFAARPPSGEFPVKRLADEIQIVIQE